MVFSKHSCSVAAAVAVLASVLVACGDPLDTSFPRPIEPLEVTLHDLVAGPITRPSGFNVVGARGTGIPRAVRLDETDQWDFAFAVLEGQPVWVPRGFFETLEATSGMVKLDAAFDQVTRVPRGRDPYEMKEPLPASEGDVYAIRSRADPALSFPCHIHAKIVVDAIEGDPLRVRFRVLWNPNCDDQNVTPREN